MSDSRIGGDVFIDGNCSAESFTFPPGTVGDVDIEGSAGIRATKNQQQYIGRLTQEYSAAAAVSRLVVHVARGGNGTVVEFYVGAAQAALGAATVTIDLLKNGTTILSATVTLDNSTPAYALKPGGSFTSSSYVKSDVFEVNVSAAVAGGGTLPKGLFAVATFREDPQ